MTSRCLYCDKRLSLFHGKKKPFCSDAHEDLYLERQALSGLDRLRDNFLEAGTAPIGRALAPTAPPLPKPREQFVYPELEPGFFDDEPASESRLPQRSADSDPPFGEFLISSAGEVQAAPPSFPFRDPVRAAFHALDLTPPVVLPGAPLLPVPVQIDPLPESVPPPLVTSLERLPMPLVAPAILPGHVDSSIIPALPDEPIQYSFPQFETQPQAIEPVAPTLITSLVSPTIRPLRIAGAILLQLAAPRTFRDSPLDMALPAPMYQPHFGELPFAAAPSTPAPPAEVLPQRGPIECLPAPEPLRFRTLLDLRVATFRTSPHRLFPAPLVPLTWKAVPPEALDWSLALQRRRPGPILPKFERYL
jgi:hypothetical protein